MSPRLVGWILPLCLTIAGCGAPKPGAETSVAEGLPDLQGRKVSFAVENGYVPFNFVRSGTGEAVGWDYDMARALGERLNFVPEFRVITWDSMIQGVVTGQFDVAGNGITITEERSRVVDYSRPYLEVHQRLLVRSDEARVKTLEEVQGSPLRIGAQKGNTNHTKAVALVGEERVVAFDGFGESVQALLTGDVDAVVVDEIGAQGYVGVHADRLRLLEGELPGQPLGYIFPKGSRLRDAFDSALDRMAADGSLEAINQRWFGPEFRLEGAPGG